MKFSINKTKLYNLTKEYFERETSIKMPKMIKCEYKKYRKTHKLKFSAFADNDTKVTDVESFLENGILRLYVTTKAFPQDWYKSYIYELMSDELNKYNLIKQDNIADT